MNWINTERGFKWSLSANGIAAFVLLILSLNPRLPVSWRRFALIGSGVTLLASKLAAEAANDASIFSERQLEKTFEKAMKLLEAEEISPSIVSIAKPMPQHQPIHETGPLSQPVPSSKSDTGFVSPVFPVAASPTVTDETGEELAAALREFGASTDFVGLVTGPTFMRYKIRPRAGVKFDSIAKLDVDLGMKLAHHIPCNVPPIISAVGADIAIDLPRPDRQIVPFEQFIDFAPSDAVQPIKIAIGVDLNGKVVEADLSDPNTCHFLVGGTTGGGKSELLRSLLASVTWRYSPKIVRLAIVDPKRVTFPELENSPYLYHPIIRDSYQGIQFLKNLCLEMKRRYGIFEKTGRKELLEYNQTIADEPLPVIICAFDEYAMLMEDKSTKDQLEDSIKSLGQQARGSGIHLIIATQRPDGNKVITPIIRSNLPVRVCLKTASAADSKIILGTDDFRGVNLLGKGDLIYQASGFSDRLQALFVSDWSPILNLASQPASQTNQKEESKNLWPSEVVPIEKWHKVSFPEDLRLLPSRSGVYAVLGEGENEIFYVGSSENLLLRWNGKYQHHRWNDCCHQKQLSKLSIACYPCSNYRDVEDLLILNLRPKWNGTSVNKAEDKRMAGDAVLSIDESKLEKIISLSTKNGWINASRVKADVWAFRNDSTHTIREYFRELASTRGLGNLRNEGESLEWSIEAA